MPVLWVGQVGTHGNPVPWEPGWSMDSQPMLQTANTYSVEPAPWDTLNNWWQSWPCIWYLPIIFVHIHIHAHLVYNLYLSCFQVACCYSVAKSCPTLQLHELQHARLPCPSLLSSHSSDSPFSFSLQSFPASGSFPMSWLVASGGQSTCFINFFKFPELTPQ